MCIDWFPAEFCLQAERKLRKRLISPTHGTILVQSREPPVLILDRANPRPIQLHIDVEYESAASLSSEALPPDLHFSLTTQLRRHVHYSRRRFKHEPSVLNPDGTVPSHCQHMETMDSHACIISGQEWQRYLGRSTQEDGHRGTNRSRLIWRTRLHIDYVSKEVLSPSFWGPHAALRYSISAVLTVVGFRSLRCILVLPLQVIYEGDRSRYSQEVVNGQLSQQPQVGNITMSSPRVHYNSGLTWTDSSDEEELSPPPTYSKGQDCCAL